MVAGVSIRVIGAEESARLAREAAGRGSNLGPAWDDIGRALTVSTQQRFADEQDPEGNPWPPSIRALMFGGKTLTDQAILRNSITHNVFGDGVEVGSDLIYAAVHQFGATITAKTDQGLMFKIGDQFVRKDSVTLPARAYLGVDAEDEAAIVQILEDHLGEPLGVTP